MGDKSICISIKLLLLMLRHKYDQVLFIAFKAVHYIKTGDITAIWYMYVYVSNHYFNLT